MKRGIYLLLFTFFTIGFASAQITPTVLYDEDFESAPYKVTSDNTSGDTTRRANWHDTTWAQAGTGAYHAKLRRTDSIYLYTDTIDCSGMNAIRLTLNHIAKLGQVRKGYIHMWDDSTNVWRQVVDNLPQAGAYTGPSPQYAVTGFWNEFSYPPGFTPDWSVSNTPAQSWWTYETFNLSYYGKQRKIVIRFSIEDIGLPFAAKAGWFIDNILVEGAPCELSPPITKPFKNTILSGARYDTSSQIVKVWVVDKGFWNEGVLDSTLLVYRSPRLTGNAWDTVTMTRISGGSASCPDSALFQYNFQNTLIVGDSVDYFFLYHDCSCPNQARYPALTNIPNYYTFWMDPSPPLICGVTTANTAPYIVAFFPWKETFEGSEWTAANGSGDQGQSASSFRGVFPTLYPPQGKNVIVNPPVNQARYAWSVRTGATFTDKTGPLKGNTFGVPNPKYLYTEASQTGDSTEFITHCLDLRSQSCMGLEFYYHMFGNQIGKLAVDIDTGDATPQWVMGVWKRSGKQTQNSQAPFERAFVSLNDYSGKYIRIRFRGVKGPGERGDIAIDDIMVYETPNTDVRLIKSLEPQNGYCSYSNTEKVIIHAQTQGCLPIDTIPLAYSVTDTNGVVTIHRDTIFNTLAKGDSILWEFNPKANLSALNRYDIKIWSEVPGDTINDNDTLPIIRVDHKAQITTFPILLDMDGPGWAPKNMEANASQGTMPNLNGISFSPSTGTRYGFDVGTAWTQTASTGPLEDFSGKGNYLYAEGDNHVPLTSDDIAATISTICMDFSSMTSPTLHFWYHLYGQDIDKILVLYTPDGENTFKVLPNGTGVVFPTSGNPPSAVFSKEKNDWMFHKVDLSFLAGKSAKIAIQGIKFKTGAQADIALDNIAIFDEAAADVGVTSLKKLPIALNDPNKVPAVVIRNYGTSPASNIPVNFTVTPACGTPYSFTHTFSGPIAPNTEQQYNLPSIPQPWGLGTIEVCATTALTGDTHTWNDSRCKTVTGWGEYKIPFTATFDTCSVDPYGFPNDQGDLRLFTVGSPTKANMNGSYTGPNSIVSSLTRPYQANYYENFRFPVFSGFDTIRGSALRFYHKFDFGSGGGGNIIYQTAPNVYKTLGFNQLGVNVYNAAAVSSLGGEPGFVGSSGTSWQYTEIPLAFYDFSTTPLVLEAQFDAGGTARGNGWQFDSIQVTVPPQNSATPIDFDAEGPIPIFIPYVDNKLSVRIKNSGAKNLTKCKVKYAIYDLSGNLVFGPTPEEQVIFSKNLRPDKGERYFFLNDWIKPAPGKYNLCIITSRPNDKKDNRPIDDSVCFKVSVLDEYFVNDSAYCNDFDDPSQLAWVTYNFEDKFANTNWEQGIPNQPPIAPMSGASPNAWMTGLNYNYDSLNGSALYTPVFQVVQDSVYKISFKHTFKTEQYHDGGTIDVTFDGGISWRTVGRYYPAFNNWFNTEYVTSLDFIKPGWTGDLNGQWIEDTLNVSFDTTAGAILRFRFGADYSFEFNGWAIDSFCFSPAHGENRQYLVGVSELEQQGVIIGNLFPNPSKGNTYMPIVSTEPGFGRIVITNMVGQQVQVMDASIQQGENIIEFNVQSWPAGIYLVNFEMNGHNIIRKLIVQ